MSDTQHSRLVDEVGRSLEEAILSGELRPGDRLTVIPLAQRFGMSQSTIREALLTLERRGLVKTKPRRGAFVTRLSEQEAVELCRMRALLEAYAVSTGIAQLSAARLAELDRQVTTMGRCVLPRSLPRLIQMDLAFHRIIAELAGSETLLETWSSLSSRIGALIMRSLEEKELNIEDVVRYHREVVDALATGDTQVARLAIIRHYIRGQADEEMQTAALTAASRSTETLAH